MSHQTDTLNWDTVFVIPISEVNKYIIKRESSPNKFEYTCLEDSIQGDFKDWQIVQGGDGSLIWLSIPIEEVSGSNQLGNYSIERGELIVEVKLQFLDHSEDEKHLTIRCSSESQTDPVVSLKSFTYSTNPTGNLVDVFGIEFANAMMGSLIISWLNEHLEEFNHIFATVNLNTYIDENEGWTWCKPSYVDYAYLDGSSLDNSLLGVLCMTGGRNATIQQIQKIDPFAIPDGSNSGFLISQERLLKDLIFPTIPMHWTSSNPNDFEVIVGGNTETGDYETILKLKDGKTVNLDPITQDGILYYPKMTNMKITLESDRIILNAYTETEINSNVTSWCQTTHKYTLTLADTLQGQTIVYKELQDADVLHGIYDETTSIEKWITIAVSGLSVLILGVMGGALAAFAGGMVMGLLTGILPEIQSHKETELSPTIDLLAFNATNPIKWSSSDVYELDSARLIGPLQLGGTLILE
ncbi:TULIP family P47-like protein [Bacillus sp. SCS-151]|uniref:TULIP family P47-like protein n=1 Tax=Nanhaiella sioensis TaxID=3115293 RepID=UPI0039794902